MNDDRAFCAFCAFLWPNRGRMPQLGRYLSNDVTRPRQEVLKMQYLVAVIASVAMFFSLGSRERLEIRDSFEFEPTTQTARKIKWPRRTIAVAFSTSLQSPGANIKPDSDVVGAARRALAR